MFVTNSLLMHDRRRDSPRLNFGRNFYRYSKKPIGVNIGCDDLICMILQIGLSDTSLQRELGVGSTLLSLHSARRSRGLNKLVGPSLLLPMEMLYLLLTLLQLLTAIILDNPAGQLIEMLLHVERE